MKKKAIFKLLAYLGAAIILVGIISWFVYPGWGKVPNPTWKLIVVVVSGVFLLSGQLVTMLNHWLQVTREEYPEVPLQPSSADKIRQSLGRGGQVNWIDRTAARPEDLRNYGRIVITGRMKQGKTREAAELIRRAVEIDLVPPDRIFCPGPTFRFLNPHDLRQTLQRGVDAQAPVLIFIDDLPFHYENDALNRLKEGLYALRTCKEVYVVATARLDQLMPGQKTWLDQQEFHTVMVPDLNDDQTARLVDAAAGTFNLQVDDAARAAFVEQGDGRPETTLISFRRLAADGITQVNAESARQFAKDGLIEAWNGAHREIIQHHPAAKFLLAALCTFHAARVRPNTRLVLAYASALWRNLPDRSWPGRHVHKLRQALHYLGHFDIADRDGRLVYPDIVVEPVSRIDMSVEELGKFLIEYRWIYQKLCFRKLYKNARNHAWAMFDLAYIAQLRNDNKTAKEYYDTAILLYRDPIFYNNRGLALADLRDYPAALEDYNRAIEIAPQLAATFFNRGNMLYDLQAYFDALADYSRAIELDPWLTDTYSDPGIIKNEVNPRLAQAYSNRGSINYDLNDYPVALEDFSRAIDLDPRLAQAYCNRGSTYYELKEYPTAIADYNRAIELDPRYVKAYHNRGVLYMVLKDYPSALADFSKAIELDPAIEFNTQDANLVYNLTCLFALQNDTTAACQWLRKAIAMAGKYLDLARTDADFDLIRGEPEFQQLLNS